jgi:hypothetical protein
LKDQATYGLVIAEVEADVAHPRVTESDRFDNELTLWVGSLVKP